MGEPAPAIRAVPAPTPLPVQRQRGVRRRVRLLGGFVVGLLVILALAAPTVISQVRRSAREELEKVFQRVKIGAVRVNAFEDAVHYEDLVVMRGSRPVIESPEVYIQLRDLFAGGSPRQVTVLGGLLRFVRDETESFGFAEVLRLESFGAKGRNRDVRPPAFQLLDMKVVYEDTRLRAPLDLTNVSASVRPLEAGRFQCLISGGTPGGGRVKVQGEFGLDPELWGRFEWSFRDVSSGELASLFGSIAPRLDGRVSGEGTLEGPMKHPALRGRIFTDWIDFRVAGVDGQRKFFLRGVDLELDVDENRRLVTRARLARLGYRGPLLPSEGLGINQLSGELVWHAMNHVTWSEVKGEPDGGGSWLVKKGSLGPQGVSLVARIDGWPFASLARLSGRSDLEAAGVMDADLELTGSRDQPDLAARVRSTSGSLGWAGQDPFSLHDLDLALRARGTGPVTVERGSVRMDDAAVQVSGILDPEDKENELEFRIDNLGVGKLARMPAGKLQGLVSLAGTLRGSREHPVVKGALSIPDLSYQEPGDGRSWDVAHFRLGFDGIYGSRGFRGRVEGLKGRVLGGALVEADGDLRPDHGGLEVSVKGLELKRLFNALGMASVSARGVADVTGVLKASADELPSASLRVSLPTLRLFVQGGPLKLSLDLAELRGGLDLAPKDDKYLLYFRDIAGKAMDGAVGVDGFVKVHPEIFYDLSLALRGVDAKRIANLINLEGFSMAGRGDVDVQVKGQAGRSTVTGRARLGNSRIYTVLGSKGYTLHPEALEGELRITPEEAVIGPLRGQLDGGRLEALYSVEHAGEDVPWKLKVRAEGVDAKRFWAHYLTQQHDISGEMTGNINVWGKGSREQYLAGSGEVIVRGRIESMESLAEAEKLYQLRNLNGIEIQDSYARISALAGRLHFRKVELLTSHGDARGDVYLGLKDGGLDGELSVSLHRKVLSSKHNLMTALEGGRNFDFSLEIGGDLQAPKYTFSSRGLFQGAAMTGALMFTPAGPAIALIQGLKGLFRRRRRRPDPAPPPGR